MILSKPKDWVLYTVMETILLEGTKLSYEREDTSSVFKKTLPISTCA